MPLPTPLSQHIIRRPQRIALLAHIAEQGSITRAAKSGPELQSRVGRHR
jgi:molybdate transport system regulatory protein